MCSVDIPFVSDVIDIIMDVVDIIVDIREDVIGWIYPMPDVPDFGDLPTDVTAKGVLLNKFSVNV